MDVYGSFHVKSPRVPNDPSQMFPKKLLKIPQCFFFNWSVSRLWGIEDLHNRRYAPTTVILDIGTNDNINYKSVDKSGVSRP